MKESRRLSRLLQRNACVGASRWAAAQAACAHMASLARGAARCEVVGKAPLHLVLGKDPEVCVPAGGSRAAGTRVGAVAAGRAARRQGRAAQTRGSTHCSTGPQPQPAAARGLARARLSVLLCCACCACCAAPSPQHVRGLPRLGLAVSRRPHLFICCGDGGCRQCGAQHATARQLGEARSGA